MRSSFAALTPRTVVAFMGTWVVALLAANLVPGLIGALVADLGMTVSEAGAMATAMSLGTALAIFGTNRLVDTGDRPTYARIGLALMTIGFGAAALILQPLPVWIGVVVGGIGCGVVISTGTAASSATKNPDNTTSTVMIVNRAAAALMLAAVPLLNNDLRSILIVLAILGLVGQLTASGLPNVPVESIQAGPDRISGLAITLAITFGLWSMTEEMVYGMTEILATEHVGLSVEESSFIISFQIIGGLVGAILAPIVLKVIGRSISILVILVVSTTSKFLIVTTTVPAVYAMAMGSWGVMYGAVISLIFGLAARMAVTGRVGMIVSSLYITGLAFGPLVGGILISQVSYFAFGLAVAIPSFIMGVILLVVSRQSGVSERGGDVDADASLHVPNAAATYLDDYEWSQAASAENSQITTKP